MKVTGEENTKTEKGKGKRKSERRKDFNYFFGSLKDDVNKVNSISNCKKTGEKWSVGIWKEKIVANFQIKSQQQEGLGWGGN